MRRRAEKECGEVGREGGGETLVNGEERETSRKKEEGEGWKVA